MAQHAFVTSQVVTDTSLEDFEIDALLRNDNDGVRALVDLAFGYSYPGGDYAGRPAPTDPTNTQIVYDVSGHDNAQFVIGSGGAPDYIGGGVDYEQCTDRGSFLEMPASVFADIYNNTDGHQYFLACLYVRLPALADWVADSAKQGTIFTGRTGASLVTEADLCTIAFQLQGGVQKIAFFRQKSAPSGTFDQINLTPSAGDFGSMAQLAFWRNASGQGARLKSVNGTVLGALAANAANTADFSTKKAQLGLPAPDWLSGLTGQATVKKYRLYRAFVENLVRSGRDPISVLDADWTRVQARIAASAAANGGASLIFV